MFKKRKKERNNMSEIGKILSEEELYSQIVSNYFKLSGSKVLSNLAEICEKDNGRVTYDEMEMILGKHYPKASWLDKNDKKNCIKTLLNHSDFFYYRADENYLYFP